MNARTVGFCCFECNSEADHAHHVVPFSRGGTRTIPLCESCHSKVHELEYNGHSQIVKEGLARAKANGVQLGRKPTVDTERAVELRAQGLSYRQIAKMLNISLGSAHVAARGVRNE